ncbi:MAG: sigma factor [Rhodospirillales bacterium]|jgi:RNA polymerase sigma factor (sigma-70 family)|nr:sigma factor [Rhodospirillales bacterium]
MDKRQAIIEQLPRLRRYARALAKGATAADDLVQDCVERALSRLALFRAGTNMRTWLFTIMHNLHVNAVRRRYRAPDSESLAPRHEARHAQEAPQHSALSARDVAGVAAGWVAHDVRGTGEANADELVRRAVGAHVVYVPEVRHPVEVASSEEAHLVAWLSKRLGQALRVPDLTSAGFQLVGGAVVAARGRAGGPVHVREYRRQPRHALPPDRP